MRTGRLAAASSVLLFVVLSGCATPARSTVSSSTGPGATAASQPASAAGTPSGQAPRSAEGSASSSTAPISAPSQPGGSSPPENNGNSPIEICPPSWISPSPSPTALAATNALMMAYLTCLTQSDVPLTNRIAQFKIDQVRVESQTSDSLVSMVIFSFKPTDMANVVLAGNGSIGSNGWINRRTLFATVAVHGRDYSILHFATSP